MSQRFPFPNLDGIPSIDLDQVASRMEVGQGYINNGDTVLKYDPKNKGTNTARNLDAVLTQLRTGQDQLRAALEESLGKADELEGLFLECRDGRTVITPRATTDSKGHLAAVEQKLLGDNLVITGILSDQKGPSQTAVQTGWVVDGNGLTLTRMSASQSDAQGASSMKWKIKNGLLVPQRLATLAGEDMSLIERAEVEAVAPGYPKQRWHFGEATGNLGAATLENRYFIAPRN